MLRDIAILWDVMEFQDGRHGHTGGPRAKGIQFRSLIAFYVRAPTLPFEISIREHVDIVVKDAMLVTCTFRAREEGEPCRESINIPATGRSLIAFRPNNPRNFARDAGILLFNQYLTN